MKDISEILTDLLTRYPESRKTDNIYKVIEWMMKYYGAITPDGKWDSQKYKKMPCISGIYRRLIEVKKLHNWFDEKAMKQENEFRETFHPQISNSTTPIPKVPQNAEYEHTSDPRGISDEHKRIMLEAKEKRIKEIREGKDGANEQNQVAQSEKEDFDLIEEAKKMGWELKS